MDRAAKTPNVMMDIQKPCTPEAFMASLSEILPSATTCMAVSMSLPW